MSDESAAPMQCPCTTDEVDLFGPGAPEQWYVAYDVLHEQAPVVRLPGEGLSPDKDAFILTKYEDVSRVIRDWDRFPPPFPCSSNISRLPVSFRRKCQIWTR